MHENVTILRGEEKDGYPFLTDPVRVTVISASAVRKPTLFRGEYLDIVQKATMQKEIAVIIGAAAHHKCNRLVLSAFGCGAFQNPPEAVAEMIRQELQNHLFQQVMICIVDDHNAKRKHNPRGNFKPFAEVFDATTPESFVP